MAFYADKDYTEDQAVLEAANQVMQGNLGLRWYNAKTEKIKYAKQLADLANALCEFATRISGVVEIFIPQNSISTNY